MISVFLLQETTFGLWALNSIDISSTGSTWGGSSEEWPKGSQAWTLIGPFGYPYMARLNGSIIRSLLGLYLKIKPHFRKLISATKGTICSAPPCCPSECYNLKMKRAVQKCLRCFILSIFFSPHLPNSGDKLHPVALPRFDTTIATHSLLPLERKLLSIYRHYKNKNNNLDRETRGSCIAICVSVEKKAFLSVT